MKLQCPYCTAPAQPQPGGEDALVEAVAEAIFETDPDAPELDDNCLDPEGVRDSYRVQANAAIATVRQWDDDNPHDQSALPSHEDVRGILGAPEPKPDVRAQALEEAAQVCEAERLSWVADETPVGAHAAAACRKAIRALIAAPPPVPAREGWQDISTAPRDGTHILVSFPNIGVWQVAWEESASGFEGWCVDDRKFGPYALRGWNQEPTHWRPLPAPLAGAAP